ncbi:unnamed protein product [Camellia sinensis]
MSSNMAPRYCKVCSSESGDDSRVNQTLRPGEEIQKLKMIKAHLNKINKPPVKTIQSPDGDVIDCVVSHQQPAFDHPQLQGKKPLIHRRGRKAITRLPWFRKIFSYGVCLVNHVQKEQFQYEEQPNKMFYELALFKDSEENSKDRYDETLLAMAMRHAVGYVSGEEYYGAKASINVWAPQVDNQYEFSLSQMWVISGSFGDDLNTIEAGWQVSPELYGDNYPRFFTYWTTDAYQATGCYNLLCSGFVQTNNMIAIGAAISPTSSYSGGQFDISLLVWKDPKHGNWWLEFGSGILVGYWPSFLFTHLRSHASMVQFGGETVNSRPSGFHTSTQMGSGHFAGEGFGKASYFRNLQIVDWDNNLIPLSNLRVLADHPNCYDIQGGINSVWGNYFYYGGPGRNAKCP